MRENDMTDRARITERFYFSVIFIYTDGSTLHPLIKIILHQNLGYLPFTCKSLNSFQNCTACTRSWFFAILCCVSFSRLPLLTSTLSSFATLTFLFFLFYSYSLNFCSTLGRSAELPSFSFASHFSGSSVFTIR